MLKHIDAIHDKTEPLPGLDDSYWWGNESDLANKRIGQFQDPSVNGIRWGDPEAAKLYCDRVARKPYAIALIDPDLQGHPPATLAQLTDTVGLCRDLLPKQTFFVGGYDFSGTYEHWDIVAGQWVYQPVDLSEQIAAHRPLVDLMQCVPSAAYCTRLESFETDLRILKVSYDAIAKAYPGREMITAAWGGRTHDATLLTVAEAARVVAQITPYRGRIALWGTLAESQALYAALRRKGKGRR